MYVLLPTYFNLGRYIGIYLHIVPLGKVCLSPERVGTVRWIRPLDSSVGFVRWISPSRRNLRLDFIEVSKNLLIILGLKFQICVKVSISVSNTKCPYALSNILLLCTRQYVACHFS